MPLEETFLAAVPENWIIEPLLIEELTILISKRHPFAKKQKLSAEDLSQLHLAYYDQLDCSCEEDPFYVSYFKAGSFSRLNRKESILQLVAENGAVAVYPPKITQLDIYRTNGQIKALALDENLNFPKIKHFLAYHKDSSDVEQKVVNLIRYVFNTYIVQSDIEDM